MTKLTDKNVESFWGAVNRGSPDECWNWRQAVDRITGYGRITLSRNGKSCNLKPHRIAHCLVNLNSRDLGDIKLLVLHSCDNKICCNPKHLREGTHLDNVKDMEARGRAWYSHKK